MSLFQNVPSTYSVNTGKPIETLPGSFPLQDVGGGMSTANEPMPRSSVQQAFKRALKQSGVHKRASVHTFRLSYATHLLEAGVNLRVIQQYLGHNSPATTSIYTHLTVKAEARAIDSINTLMQDL